MEENKSCGALDPDTGRSCILAVGHYPPVPHLLAQQATAEQAGCWLEGAASRTADELNAETVKLAGERGRPVSELERQLLYRLEDGRSEISGTAWLQSGEDSDALSEAANGALEWPNAHVAPEGYSFEFDDGLYLYPDETITDEEEAAQ